MSSYAFPVCEIFLWLLKVCSQVNRPVLLTYSFLWLVCYLVSMLWVLFEKIEVKGSLISYGINKETGSKFNFEFLKNHTYRNILKLSQFIFSMKKITYKKHRYCTLIFWPITWLYSKLPTVLLIFHLREIQKVKLWEHIIYIDCLILKKNNNILTLYIQTF